MLYEIVNPSDPYTIEANGLAVAFVACIFLGRGQYAFKPLEDGGEEVPLFMFGGADKWCEEHLHESMESVLDRVASSAELAECFESCLIGKATDRATYYAGLELIDDPAKRDEWRRQWHEGRLSSMNDIGGRACAMAAKIRAGAKNPLINAPQQVFAG